MLLFLLSTQKSESEKYVSFLRSNVSFRNLDFPIQQDIATLIPDIQILTFFQEQSEELDALSTSRAHFATIETDLLWYTDKNIEKRVSQEESLKKLHNLQNSMKNSQKATEKEIEKLKKTINDSEREVRALERKKQETQALLKKFYQKKYIYDTYQNENVNFMTLLMRKSFGTSIQDSEVMKTMQLFSYNLSIIQNDTQEEINKTLKIIESQKALRVRMSIELDQYNAELAATENLESELF